MIARILRKAALAAVLAATVFHYGTLQISAVKAALAAAGYPADAALVLALDREVDLHFAVSLLERGCPPDTALEILF